MAASEVSSTSASRRPCEEPRHREPRVAGCLPTRREMTVGLDRRCSTRRRPRAWSPWTGTSSACRRACTRRFQETESACSRNQRWCLVIVAARKNALLRASMDESTASSSEMRRSPAHPGRTHALTRFWDARMPFSLVRAGLLKRWTGAFRVLPALWHRSDECPCYNKRARRGRDLRRFCKWPNNSTT